MKTFSKLIVSQENNVGTITLNSPETANAFTEEMFNEVADAFNQLSENVDVKVILLNAEGKLFSGGGDIQMFKEVLSTKAPLSMDLCLSPGRMVEAIRSCSKPVIASVQGSAAGAALGAILACDYRILTSKTKLVTAFTGIGLSGDSGLQYFLGKAVGVHRAIELMTINPLISSSQALEWGLANEVVEPEVLEEAERSFANKLTKLPTNVFAYQKNMVNQTLYPELKLATNLEAIYTHMSSKDHNFIEGVSAFLEKRPANFQ